MSFSSQFYHLKAIQIYINYINNNSPFFSHMIASYLKHYTVVDP